MGKKFDDMFNTLLREAADLETTVVKPEVKVTTEADDTPVVETNVPFMTVTLQDEDNQPEGQAKTWKMATHMDSLKFKPYIPTAPQEETIEEVMKNSLRGGFYIFNFIVPGTNQFISFTSLMLDQNEYKPGQKAVVFRIGKTQMTFYFKDLLSIYSPITNIKLKAVYEAPLGAEQAPVTEPVSEPVPTTEIK